MAEKNKSDKDGNFRRCKLCILNLQDHFNLAQMESNICDLDLFDRMNGDKMQVEEFELVLQDQMKDCVCIKVEYLHNKSNEQKILFSHLFK